MILTKGVRRRWARHLSSRLASFALEQPRAKSSSTVQFIVVGGDPFRDVVRGRWLQTYKILILKCLAAAASPTLPVIVADPEWLAIPAIEHPDPVSAWMAMVAEPLSAETLRQIVEMKDGAYFGFETPDQLWREIAATCSVAIDIRIHPIRFASEPLLLVRSVGVSWPEGLDTDMSDWLAFEASFMRTRGAIVDPSGQQFEDGVFALQVPRDGALLSNGEFAKLSAHTAELIKWASSFRRVNIVLHPFSDPDPDALKLLLSLPNAWFSGRNIYSLMIDPNVVALSAISSSVLHEAQALGLAVTALRPDLSHGFPLRDEYRAMEMEDVVAALHRRVTGREMSERMRKRIPTVRALFGPVGTDASRLAHSITPPLLGPGVWSVAETPFASALDGGWAAPESWGRWMIAPLAALTFVWPEGQMRPMKIELRFDVLVSPSAPTNDVEIWSGGKCLIVGSFNAQPGSSVALTFDLAPPVDSNLVQVQIVKAYGYCPAEVYGSEDGRNLRIGLREIAVSWAP